MRNSIIILICILIGFIYSQCYGDSNLDQNVNIQDIILVINHITANKSLEDQSYTNSDVNTDNIIDVIDIILIVNIVLSDDIQCDIFLDLSIDWQIQEDLSYFDSYELLDIIDNQISQLSNIKGVIIIHEGKIIGENYYNNSSVDEYFNIWSVTKSFTSTLIGQAIDQGLIFNPNLTLDNFLPDYNIYSQYYLEQITLKNLLTMTSGYYDVYGYPFWVNATTYQLVSMIHGIPGQFMYNNSACHLNNHILFELLDMTPLEFANLNLFPYLGINNPNWTFGYNGINDGSASLELRLRDMVKLGQLYIQNGWSGDNQILSTDWIQEATQFQVQTGFNWNGLNSYGYLWWLPDDGGYLAYGYGGQFIAVFPERNLVIGTRSLDYNVTDNYLTSLLGIIYNDIIPLFEADSSVEF